MMEAASRVLAADNVFIQVTGGAGHLNQCDQRSGGPAADSKLVVAG